MSSVLKFLLALIIAPLIPWVVYGVVFTGVNLPRLLADEAVVDFVNSSVLWDFSLFSVMTALAAGLYYGFGRKPASG